MVLIPIKSWNSVSRENFIPLRQQDAVQEQKELLKAWEPASDVWSLKYGSTAIALTASICSIAVNGLFRAKLKLHSHGRILTNLCATMIPGTLSAFLHDEFVTENIMMFKPGCPLCYEMKSALILNSTAIFFPLITMPFINLAVAGSVGLRIPYIFEIREIANFWWNTVKPATTQLSFLCVSGTLCASAVTYKQFSSMEMVGNVLLQIEKDLKENEG